MKPSPLILEALRNPDWAVMLDGGWFDVELEGLDDFCEVKITLDLDGDDSSILRVIKDALRLEGDLYSWQHLSEISKDCKIFDSSEHFIIKLQVFGDGNMFNWHRFMIVCSALFNMILSLRKKCILGKILLSINFRDRE